jgi:hypothetical protein
VKLSVSRKTDGTVLKNVIFFLELLPPATGVQAVQHIIVIDLYVQQINHMNLIRLILYCRYKYTGNIL